MLEVQIIACRMVRQATVFCVFSLINSVLCQTPGLLAALGGGGAGMMGLGMDLGNIQEYAMMRAMSNMVSPSGGGATSASASGGSGTGMDPLAMAMMGGGGLSSDALQMAAFSNMMNIGNQGNGGGRGSGGNQQQGAQPSMASNIANMLSAGSISASPISPGQQNALWGIVQMSGNTHRITDALTSPSDRIQMERDGLPNIDPMMSMMMCPPPAQCGFPMCESTEIPFTPESFYVCRGCPRCRMDTSQRRMMTLFRQMGGPGAGGAGGNIMDLLALSGGASSSAMTPALMASLMRAQPPSQPQSSSLATSVGLPLPSSSSPRTSGGRSGSALPAGLGRLPSSASSLSSSMSRSAPSDSAVPASLSRPPPEFIAAMRAMSESMASRRAQSGSSNRSGRPPKPPADPAI